MLANNDKFVISLVNFKDFDNHVIDYSCKLPKDIPNDILDKVSRLDVFEYHEGNINTGYIAFSIYVGNITTINNLVSNKDNFKFVNINKSIDLDTPVLYRKIDNTKLIVNILNANDVVVKDREELKNVLNLLSNEVLNINASVNNVRSLIRK